MVSEPDPSQNQPFWARSLRSSRAFWALGPLSTWAWAWRRRFPFGLLSHAPIGLSVHVLANPGREGMVRVGKRSKLIGKWSSSLISLCFLGKWILQFQVCLLVCFLLKFLSFLKVRLKLNDFEWPKMENNEWHVNRNSMWIGSSCCALVLSCYL